MTIFRPGALIALSVALALSACARPSDSNANLESLDAELADGNSSGNRRDPALTAALRDQIMVDPQLVGQSNGDAVRPASQPYAAPVPAERPGGPAPVVDQGTSTAARPAPAPKPGGCPSCAARREALTLGGLAERQTGARGRGCARGISYSAAWATRLPADLPLYPDAHVVEAAGNASGGCALRVVSFTSAATPAAVIDWYNARATGAGYSAEHQADGDEHVLAGARGDDAYALFLRPRDGGGVEADLVVNAGR